MHECRKRAGIASTRQPALHQEGPSPCRHKPPAHVSTESPGGPVKASSGGTLLAILALAAFSIAGAPPFRDVAGQEHVAAQLEFRHDLSNHRHAELAHVSAVPVIQPATRLENELVLAGHRYTLYLNEGIVTSSKSAVAAAARSPHRYDQLRQQLSSTDNDSTQHRVTRHDRYV